MRLQKRSTAGVGGWLSGLIVGFIIGSLTTYSIVGSGIFSIVGKSSSAAGPSFSTVERKDVASHFTKATEANAHETIINTTTTSSSSSPSSPSAFSYLDEIMPDSLRQLYAPDKLAFPVTLSMLRRSRPIIGNNQRLHLYLSKLHGKQCTTVVFMGGSVTAGHGAGGRENAYPKLFIDWLNERYPCINTKTTTKGNHIAKYTNAQNSQTHFTVWSSVVDASNDIDLVMMEFNVNDEFIPDMPHVLEDKGPGGEIKEYKSAWYTEAILRRLLLLRTPDPLAIITFNADYTGSSWQSSEDTKYRKTLSRMSPEPTKLWISALYEIPVISASIWMLPLASKRGNVSQFQPPNENKYSTKAWHSDSCCHPRGNGHLILSMILAYNFVEEEKVMQHDSDVADVERDFTADESLLRDPLYLSAEEEKIYVRTSAMTGTHDNGLDFTDSSGESMWRDKVMLNEGWDWYPDNKDKDKYGFIANNVTGGPHVAFSMTGGDHGLVELSYVISYENFGIALAWLDNEQNNTRSKECNEPIQLALPIAKGKLRNERLIAIWDENVSVPTVQILKHKLELAQSAILHICLTPRYRSRNGSEHKFKLLGVRVY